jgi:hypothetical protein
MFGNEVQCVLSYVVMENSILPTVPRVLYVFFWVIPLRLKFRLLGCFPVSDVGFFIVMMNMLLSHSCSIYSETYYINGLTVNVYVPSYFNDVK